jgi:multiple sugar transport system permease protein/N,N'-diacetylchitobiose transport system permease protein
VGTQSVSLYVYQMAFARDQQNLGLGSAVNILMMVVMLALVSPFIRQIYREVRAK